MPWISLMTFGLNTRTNMKELIKKMLKESIDKTESTQEFYNRFKQTNTNPEFLNDNFKNPDFQLRMTSDGGVKLFDFKYAESNRCETNVFNFIKSMMRKNIHRYYPVSGWCFMKSTTYFEHFWVYDEVSDMFLDVSPISEGKPLYAYGGVVNMGINDDILRANEFSDIEFLKGKVSSSLYSNHIDKDSSPNLDPRKGMEGDEDSLFKYVMTNKNYEEVQWFFGHTNVNSIEGLKNGLGSLKNFRDSARNNRDYDKANLAISKIESL